MFTRQLKRAVTSVNHLSKGFKTSCPGGTMVQIKVGDSLPQIDLYKLDDKGIQSKSTKDFYKGTHVVFGIFGAFTGPCGEQVPTFIKEAASIKAKGVDSINCVSVNDPFCMKAYADSMGAGDSVEFLADREGAFTKAIDLEFDGTGLVGNIRSQRYVMVVKDGKVTKLNVEQNTAEVSCTAAKNALELL